MSAVQVVSKDIEGRNLVLGKAVRGIQTVVYGLERLFHLLLEGIVSHYIDAILSSSIIGRYVIPGLTGNLIPPKEALPWLLFLFRFFLRFCFLGGGIRSYKTACHGNLCRRLSFGVVIGLFMPHQKFREPPAHTIQPGGKKYEENDNCNYLSKLCYAEPDYGLRRPAPQATTKSGFQAGENAGKGQYPRQQERQRKQTVEPFFEAEIETGLKQFYAPGKEEGHYAECRKAKTVSYEEPAYRKAGLGSGICHFRTRRGRCNALVLLPCKHIGSNRNCEYNGEKQYEGYPHKADALPFPFTEAVQVFSEKSHYFLPFLRYPRLNLAFLPLPKPRFIPGREKDVPSEILLSWIPSGTFTRPSERRSISWKIVESETVSLFQMRYCCLM